MTAPVFWEGRPGRIMTNGTAVCHVRRRRSIKGAAIHREGRQDQGVDRSRKWLMQHIDQQLLDDRITAASVAPTAAWDSIDTDRHGVCGRLAVQDLQKRWNGPARAIAPKAIRRNPRAVAEQPS